MSIEIYCHECGKVCGIANNPGAPVRCLACSLGENRKPKCPVFGCTIPRGIPHEHPAGVSAVMRDPAAPLNADERAELDQLRARVRQSELLTAARIPGVYVVPAETPIHGRRKLRDALLMAGHNVEHFDMAKDATMEAIKPRRSLVRTIGRIAAGIVVAAGAVALLILLAMTSGWL